MHSSALYGAGFIRRFFLPFRATISLHCFRFYMAMGSRAVCLFARKREKLSLKCHRTPNGASLDLLRCISSAFYFASS